MKKIVIIGTMAFDTVKTPFGKVAKALGGSASYASLAASFFSHPHVVSIIGEDFYDEYLQLFHKKGIDTEGVVRKGKTFHWEGSYEFAMNEAKTIKTDLNNLVDFTADLPDKYKDATHVFLANIDPELQAKVIDQLTNPEVIVMDTMNFWIDTKKDKLLEVIPRATILVINDGEARQLFGTSNLVKAAKDALALGPKAVIIKKGEHGALLFTPDKHFSAPSYPLEIIKDPTGCGDCFGGGLLGYLSQEGNMDDATMRKAIIYGSVIASHNAEDFSVERLKELTKEDIEKRFEYMKEIRGF